MGINCGLCCSGCGPPFEVQVEERPVTVRRAQWRGNRRFGDHHLQAVASVRQEPGRGPDDGAEAHQPRLHLHA